MQEQQVTVTVARAEITDIQAARQLQDWCEAKDGLICFIVARAEGGYSMSVEGVGSHRKEFGFGDTVSWDGTQFLIELAQPLA